MTDETKSPLRRRMIEDMTIRNSRRRPSTTKCRGSRTSRLLPKGLHRICHYGLFTKSACAANIARAHELLAAAKPLGEPTGAAADPSKPSCPCCGSRMIVIEVFERGAAPRHRPTGPTTIIRIDTS